MHPAIALQPVLESYRALGPAIYWTITAIGAVWCFLIVYGVVGYGACANTGTVPCDAYSYWAVDARRTRGRRTSSTATRRRSSG